MEKVYFSAKKHITHFKLDFCCWFAPVRVGLIFVGYINIIIDLVCMMGIANDGLSPTITKVQENLLGENVSKPIPVLAYAIELGFNVVLLCAIYRRDIVLLRVFLYYTVMAVIMSIMTYSIVLAAVPFHIQLAIVTSILFQSYCILLIRSVIVEIKTEGKNYELPRLVMSSLIKDRAGPCIYDPNNGKIQEVTIAEVPKKQEVQVTVIGPDEKTKDTKITETKKAAEVKLDTDVKNGAELKKDADVKVQIESKENKDDKKKDEKKTKEEKKKEEKAIKEQKKKEEKKIKEEKKKEGNKIKEEKKKDEKITSMILKQYKDEKDAEQEAKTKDSKKDLKEISLQTVSEHPKE